MLVRLSLTVVECSGFVETLGAFAVLPVVVVLGMRWILHGRAYIGGG